MTGRHPNHKLFFPLPSDIAWSPSTRALSSFILPLLGVPLNGRLIDYDQEFFSEWEGYKTLQECIFTKLKGHNKAEEGQFLPTTEILAEQSCLPLDHLLQLRSSEILTTVWDIKNDTSQHESLDFRLCFSILRLTYPLLTTHPQGRQWWPQPKVPQSNGSRNQCVHWCPLFTYSHMPKVIQTFQGCTNTNAAIMLNFSLQRKESVRMYRFVSVCTLVDNHLYLLLKFLTSDPRTVLGHILLVRKPNCSIFEGTLTLSGSIE